MLVLQNSAGCHSKFSPGSVYGKLVRYCAPDFSGIVFLGWVFEERWHEIHGLPLGSGDFDSGHGVR